MIRKALVNEADELSSIARLSKAHWNYPEAWLDQWHEQLAITERSIADDAVFVHESDGHLDGFYVLVISGNEARLEHLWLRPESMGKGTGRSLFEHAAALAVERGAKVMTIESDPFAEGFYKAMGTVRIGEIPANMDGTERVLPLMQLQLS